MEQTKRIHLSPRLQMAAELLGSHQTVADIGCDHGRLSVSLLQQQRAKRVIAIDVKELPLSRAKALAAYTCYAEQISLRLGDGFLPLAPGEADAAVICGMGGTLMARLLAACPEPCMGAALCVMQPMRGVEDIRQYLFEHRYRIVEDRVVQDAGRLYQVFSAVPNEQDVLPAGWPEGFYFLGHRAMLLHDPLFPVLANHMLSQHEKRLLTAAGRAGAKRLEERIKCIRAILALYYKQEEAAWN
ncbi:MAG: class I SAM-dependent methyltransferase [Eubacteriales bacterium]|nr:class I SAM-dependent methyltransferase [Eubacteriales bacterium]